MKAAAFLEKATASVFIGIALAAACSIGLGMLGGLFTLNEDSVLQGVSTMIIGVFIQAPIFAVLAGILTLLVLTAARPVLNRDKTWVLEQTQKVAFGAGMIWALFQITVAGIQISYWPAMVGTVVGGLFGLSTIFAEEEDETTKSRKKMKRKRPLKKPIRSESDPVESVLLNGDDDGSD